MSERKKKARAKPGPKPAAVKPEKLQVYVPPDVAHAFRVHCAVAKLTQSEAATQALSTWLSREGSRPPHKGG